MASGKLHHQATMVTGTLTTGLSTITFSPEIILGSIVSTIVAIFYNPDTDLPSNTHGENKVGKIPVFGKLLQIILLTITMPYAMTINHRSQWSHLPIVSDIVRYFYLEFWIFLFGFIFEYDSPTIFNAIFKTFTQGNVEGYIEWLIWITSPMFWGYFLTAIVQTAVHTLILDGGMVEKSKKNSNKNKRHYILGKEWYNKCRKWFN